MSMRAAGRECRYTCARTKGLVGWLVTLAAAVRGPQAPLPAAMSGSNPFRMPTDEEVFALRDEEQQRKKQERERARELHVWEKGVKSRAPAKDHSVEAPAENRLNLVAAATRDRRKEKENMADFIAKKREMFLVQMSLDTKRAEIRKLEERAQQREEALRKSEQMLEEDALRFDQFLKDNDQKAVQAIKKAEAETKAKAEKVQEIKCAAGGEG